MRHCAYKDNVIDLHVAVWMTLVYNLDAPLAGLLVVLGTTLDGSFGPDIQFHGLGIMLEPACKLVLWSCVSSDCQWKETHGRETRTAY